MLHIINLVVKPALVSKVVSALGVCFNVNAISMPLAVQQIRRHKALSAFENPNDSHRSQDLVSIVIKASSPL